MNEVIYRNGKLLTVAEFEEEVRKDERAKTIEEYRKEMRDIIEGNENFIDWQKYEILECNDIVAEELKEQNK